MFVWSSRRPPMWEASIHNMNVAIGTGLTFNFSGTEVIPSVNSDEMNPEFFKESHDILNGQIISQFENEAFKFVIETNKTPMDRDSQLMIKPYMLPDMGLNQFNCKPFNLDKINTYLETNEWVALGFFINGNSELEYEERANTLAKSIYYTRKDGQRLYDLDNDEYLPNNYRMNCVTYIVFRKLADPEIVIGTVNPHLISIPNMDSGQVDDNHNMCAMNAFDSDIAHFMINPVINHADVIDDIIVPTADEFEIHLFEKTMLKYLFNKVGEFPVEIKTNLEYTRIDNKYTFKNRDGYIIFKIKTDDMMHKHTHPEQSGYYTLKYKIYGD